MTWREGDDGSAIIIIMIIIIIGVEFLPGKQSVAMTFLDAGNRATHSSIHPSIHPLIGDRFRAYLPTCRMLSTRSRLSFHPPIRLPPSRLVLCFISLLLCPIVNTSAAHLPSRERALSCRWSNSLLLLLMMVVVLGQKDGWID